MTERSEIDDDSLTQEIVEKVICSVRSASMFLYNIYIFYNAGFYKNFGKIFYTDFLKIHKIHTPTASVKAQRAYHSSATRRVTLLSIGLLTFFSNF